MPHYRWQGVDEQGILKEGTLRTSSVTDLQDHLSKSSIALVASQQISQKAFTSAEKDLLFTYIATLLQAHIPLYEALVLMGTTHPSKKLRTLGFALSTYVAQGISFTQVLEEYRCHDVVSQALIPVGEATGTLGPLLHEIVLYRTSRTASFRLVQQALLIPMITLIFFVFLCSGIIVYVVPQIVHYCVAFSLEVPSGLQQLWSLSLFCTPYYLMMLSSILLLLIVIVSTLGKTERGRKMKEQFFLQAPGMSFFYRTFMRARLLKTVGLLLTHHIPLSSALKTCEEVTDSIILKKQIREMRQLVDQGISLSVAWEKSSLHTEETASYIALGEQSGRLADMIMHIAQQDEKRFQESLQRMISLLNPLGVLFLGLIMASLIACLYIPLITLSSAIG